MVRITERLTLCNSRPSGKQQITQCCGKAILTPQNYVSYVTYIEHKLPCMSRLAVCDHRPHTLLITYSLEEKPMPNS
jgi:hypothetical protein